MAVAVLLSHSNDCIPFSNEIDPKCLLCANEEENIEHFILNCKSLSKVRNTILQELITTFNTLGIKFDELSANEKLENMYVPVSSFNFIGNLAASMTEWQLILKKGMT
jgi:hypothetical protein